ncbi:hypothetical protein HK098_006407 [Nowakowskiella sp. JEL0407]|nr:hypothetical protein HK098_006407 [Nowakowskiella sp. JEL0407]
MAANLCCFPSRTHYKKNFDVDLEITETPAKKMYPIKSLKATELPLRLVSIAAKRSELVTDENAQQIIQDGGYAIVSHVWGRISSAVVSFNGVNWRVPTSSQEKIDSILRHAQEAGHLWLWMDILCIDQGNETEKLSEMPKMGNYYKNARSTVVVVDCGTLVCEKAMWDCINYSGGLDKLKVIGEYGTVISHQFAQCSIAVGNLFSEMWFWRVWTYQECLLSNDFEVICSHGDTAKLTIDEWLDIAMKMHLLHSQSYPGSLELLHWKVSRDFSAISEIAHVRKSMRKAHEGDLSHGKQLLTTILTAVFSRDCFFTDDRLFGILGLLSYGENLVVEYGKIVESFQKLAKLAVTHGDASILAMKKADKTKGVERSDALQRNVWEIDWEKPEIGWGWLGILQGGAPTSEFSDLKRVSPSRKGIEDDSIGEIDNDGILSIDCIEIGTIRWISTGVRSTTDPEDVVELISQLHYQAGCSSEMIAEWLASLVPASRGKAAIPAAVPLVEFSLSLGDSRDWDLPKAIRALKDKFYDDGVHGDHGFWDLRNIADMVFQQYGNRVYGKHIGCAAVVKSPHGEDHIVVLDQRAPIDSRVFGYAIAERGTPIGGVMTLICEKYKDSDMWSVIARSTPIHMSADKLTKYSIVETK